MNPTALKIKLSKDRAWIRETFAAMSEADLNRGIATSRHNPEAKWSAKDHVAHLVGIEKVFNQIIRQHLEGKSKTIAVKDDGSRRSQEELMAMVDAMNEIWVTEHHNWSLDEIVALGQKVRAETLALLAGLSDAQLNEIVPAAPFPDATIGGILALNGTQAYQHYAWVKEALAKNE